MKKIVYIASLFVLTAMISCNNNPQSASDSTATSESTIAPGGQENVQDDVSQKDVVKIAVASPDHTTLVAALKQAGLVTSLANAGPFTVFAPTNAAFDKLPKGVVADLMKDANKDKLVDALQYHVFVSALQPDFLNQEQTLNMVDGNDLKITMENGKPLLNGKAHIIASVPASNGIVYVIDEVLLPQSK